MNLNSLITIASFIPNSLQSPNAWVGHLAFAAWLTQEVRPKILVELGTHTGNSYFAFCQSVVEGDVATKCYAVDTWQGDEHAGLYGDEIFAKVNAYHQEHYSKFSSLLRTTFDEAVSYFSDQSIDILHIDGLHTYEAVRHDFETWLPKLAPGAIILFHDTNVREQNFGVWKLWEELQVRYPNNLEFVHSNGLGVLQLNNAPDEKKLEWLQPDSPEKQSLISYFTALGLRQLESFELNEQKQHIVNLNQAVSERDERLNETIAQNVSLSQMLDKQNSMINTLLSSTSWRLTKPLRWLGRPILRIKLLLKSLALANNYTGDIGQTFIKLVEVYKNEGLQGVKSRIRFLLTNNVPQSDDLNVDSQQPHFAPPTGDYCLMVPFNYPIKKPTIVPSLAVVCHMFYPELLEEFKNYLSNIPFSFDLFITTDSEEKKATISNGLSGWHKGGVEIRIAPNRGRNIAPQLISCRDVYDRYEFFLHIHSKKSPHASETLAGWRHYLLETLLGSENIVASIFEAFTSDPKLGMIAPQHFTPIQNAIGWGWNFAASQEFSSQLGITLSLNGKIDFPSGSMFWGRSAAIKPLLEMPLSLEDFPSENAQLDATLAHIIERLYFFVCEQAGYRWVKIVYPSLFRSILVESKDSLINSIKRTQYNLLVSND